MTELAAFDTALSDKCCYMQTMVFCVATAWAYEMKIRFRRGGRAPSLLAAVFVRVFQCEATACGS